MAASLRVTPSCSLLAMDPTRGDAILHRFNDPTIRGQVRALQGRGSGPLDCPQNDQEDDRANDRGNDGGDETGADADAQSAGEPAADQGADNAHDNVADEAKPAAFDQLAG